MRVLHTFFADPSPEPPEPDSNPAPATMDVALNKLPPDTHSSLPQGKKDIPGPPEIQPGGKLWKKFKALKSKPATAEDGGSDANKSDDKVEDTGDKKDAGVKKKSWKDKFSFNKKKKDSKSLDMGGGKSTDKLQPDKPIDSKDGKDSLDGKEDGPIDDKKLEVEEVNYFGNKVDGSVEAFYPGLPGVAGMSVKTQISPKSREDMITSIQEAMGNLDWANLKMKNTKEISAYALALANRHIEKSQELADKPIGDLLRFTPPGPGVPLDMNFEATRITQFSIHPLIAMILMFQTESMWKSKKPITYNDFL